MTENEAIEILKSNFPKTCKMIDGKRVGGFNDTECEFGQAFLLSILALTEIQKYREVGTVDECRENKRLLEFLYDTINPNDMESYLSIYNASNEKSD